MIEPHKLFIHFESLLLSELKALSARVAEEKCSPIDIVHHSLIQIRRGSHGQTSILNLNHSFLFVVKPNFQSVQEQDDVGDIHKHCYYWRHISYRGLLIIPTHFPQCPWILCRVLYWSGVPKWLKADWVSLRGWSGCDEGNLESSDCCLKNEKEYLVGKMSFLPSTKVLPSHRVWIKVILSPPHQSDAIPRKWNIKS